MELGYLESWAPNTAHLLRCFSGLSVFRLWKDASDPVLGPSLILDKLHFSLQLSFLICRIG